MDAACKAKFRGMEMFVTQMAAGSRNGKILKSQGIAIPHLLVSKAAFEHEAFQHTLETYLNDNSMSARTYHK